MAQKLIATIILFVTVEHIVSAIEPECEDCGCCVNNTCERVFAHGDMVDNYCIHGCIDGYGGNRCYHKCPDDCVTCEHRYYSNCATCETGKYLSMIAYTKRCLDCPTRCKSCTSTTNCQECSAPYYNNGSNGNCSSTCPTNCKSCTSATQCQECNTPYYNDGDVTNCSLSCPENCLCQYVGICSSCQEGFFNISSQRQNVCPDKCKTCTGTDTCKDCKEGYYNGKQYDKATSSEISDCSLGCRENCTSCNSYNQCTNCTDDKYGDYCQFNCSVGCKNGNCAADYGSCQCKDEFTGITCSECVKGRYGETCNKLCPSTCKDKMCIKHTGLCLSCQPGLFGIVCEHNCSDGCQNSECDSETGSCMECVPSYSGNKCCIQNGFCDYCSSNIACETCTNGYHGDGCNKACPAMCKLLEGTELCERTSGYCTACADGFYGNFCDSACSYQCLNNRCVKDNGHCSEGCLNGYEGPTCAVLANNLSAGMAVGISSAVTIVIVAISIITSFIILRKWFRHVLDSVRQHQKPNILASYVNDEFQSIPAETVQSMGNDDHGDNMVYEELDECNLKLKTADYNQIHA